MTTTRSGPVAWALCAATIVAVSCGGAEFGGSIDGGGTGGSGGPTGTSTGGSGGSVGVGGSTTTGTGGGSTGGAGGGTGGSGAGGSGGTCASSGSVTFQLIPGGLPGSPGYCVGACGASWVTIKSATGQVLGNIDHGCFASCIDCSPVACPAVACIAPHRLASTGEEMTWNGTLWAQNMCSESNGIKLACVNQVCVSPGPLIATMCGYPNMTPDGGSYCLGGQTPKCVDVPFTYPTATVVTGVLDPVR